ncbi:hypothetical protein [Actinoallomurus iriomotensis]|uniref:Secreted protein n=1 Tax=Actinoallomurus iriomotensis TaxID=478107 RepID=A0A9W6RWN5_9ACTN|nr:hypothetical protein [Actinoallomurus iriomotensis]GLY81482.1 hypothetical protein Airi01_097490 [Actinoallomurus iriomotensis]
MRLSAPLPLGLTLSIAAGVLALAPVAQAATAATGEPTYTCQTDTPGNTGVPILIHGIGCRASGGAPATGVSGPVKLVIAQPRYHPRVSAWTCRQARALGSAGALEVMAVDCRP